MSNVQTAMKLLIVAFHQYSGEEGDNSTLSKKELTNLLTAELGESPGASDKGAWDKIFADLDTDKNGTVDFKEYVTLVACLTMLCNDLFKQHSK